MLSIGRRVCHEAAIQNILAPPPLLPSHQTSTLCACRPLRRSWHFSKAGVNAFRQLADWFQREGLIRIDSRAATVLLTWVVGA